MREIGVLEAKTRFSALVSEVEEKGGEITVTRHGRPIVKIVKVDPPRPTKVSGEELARRFRELRDSIVARNPEAGLYDPIGVMRGIRDEDEEE